ncbi:hypothetical protein HII17_03755 [Thalassotalea sp. M1531]|uniref:Solute-binding protein family 3/N-terminal domain-containing protein n=1 Tax=Thalassotalea algicola TaxID=2716224 RepID=A0A7Y0L9X5_9GAMM|nr:hypothetical protein [Thalassotalea algicola]NMP30669.1 hypothetical protein [Thalassotalea algicola]
MSEAGDAAPQKSTEQKPTIMWLIEDKQENVDILAENTKQTPTATYIEKIITSQLAKYYDVKFERVSMSRINFSLKNRDNACAANRANTAERRSYSIFSKPQAFYLTHKLYRFNQQSPLPESLLNSQGELNSIAKVFEHFPNAKIGVAENVSYGEFLDQRMAEVNKKNIYYRSGNNRVTALEAMLYSNRVDYLLALPVDIKPSDEQKGLVERYSIAGAPQYLPAYFNCANSQLGQQVINKLSELLTNLYTTEVYYLSHKNTFSENELVKLKQYLKQHYADEPILKTK